MDSVRRLSGSQRAVRERPGLVVAGLVVGIADLTWLALVAAAVVGYGGGLWGAIAMVLFGRLFLIAAVAAVLPGTYEALRGEPESGRATLSTVVREARRSGLTLFTASLAAHVASALVVLVVGLAALTLALGVDTLAQVALGVAGGRGWATSTSLAVAVAIVATVLARVPFAFHDVVALSDEESPVTAWRVSVRSVLGRREHLGSYALSRLVLLAVPALLAMGAGFVVDAVVEGLFGIGRYQYMAVQAAFVGTFVLATGIARPVLAAFHLRTVDERLSFTDPPRRASRYRPAVRTLLACVVILAAAVGVAAVRVADVGPTPGQPPEAAVGQDDPSTVLEIAAERTIRSSHTMTYRTRGYNETSGEWTSLGNVTARIDRDDWRRSVRANWWQSGPEAVVYTEDGRVATTNGGRDVGVADVFRVVRERGQWTVATGPPEPFFDEIVEGYPDPSLPWSVVDETENTVVYGLSDPETLHRVGGYSGVYPPPSDPNVTYRDGNRVRVAVDRDTSRLVRITAAHAYEYREDGETKLSRTESTVRFAEYGSTDVARPDDLGPRSAYAVLWDAVSYRAAPA